MSEEVAEALEQITGLRAERCQACGDPTGRLVDPDKVTDGFCFGCQMVADHDASRYEHVDNAGNWVDEDHPEAIWADDAPTDERQRCPQCGMLTSFTMHDGEIEVATVDVAEYDWDLWTVYFEDERSDEDREAAEYRVVCNLCRNDVTTRLEWDMDY